MQLEVVAAAAAAARWRCTAERWVALLQAVAAAAERWAYNPWASTVGGASWGG